MNYTLNDLYSLKRTDLKNAINAAAQAYFEAEDEPFRIPDPSKRLRYIKILMKVTLKHALKFGKVYSPTSEIEGIAAWLPHDRTHIPLWRYIRYGVLGAVLLAGFESLISMSNFDSIVKEKHKQHANFPHMYLYNLAVNPKYQGKGMASRLLKPMFKVLDKKKLPCYLETGENNLNLYQHFGFEVLEHIPMKDQVNDAYFMLRKPKS